MIIVLLSCVYLLFFLLLEWLNRKKTLPHEFARKSAHVLIAISLIPVSLILSLRQIQLTSFLFFLVMLVSRKYAFFRSIHQTKRRSYGELFYPLGIIIAASLTSSRNVFLYGVLIMGVCDGLAALMGRMYGKKMYTIGIAEKSFIGSSAFFLTAFGITLFFFSIPDTFTRIVVSVVLAVLLTLTEAVSPLGLDNLLLSIEGILLLSLTSGLFY